MTNEMREIEWQCGHCGKWVSTAWWRHAHFETVTPNLSEMLAARHAGDDSGGASAVFVPYARTGKEPRRIKPNE